MSTKLAFWACQFPGYDKCQNQPFLGLSHKCKGFKAKIFFGLQSDEGGGKQVPTSNGSETLKGP